MFVTNFMHIATKLRERDVVVDTIRSKQWTRTRLRSKQVLLAVFNSNKLRQLAKNRKALIPHRVKGHM